MNLVINASEAIGQPGRHDPAFHVARDQRSGLSCETSYRDSARRRLRAPGSVRHRLWDDRGGKREDLRSVFHHEIRRPWSRTRRCSGDRASPRRRGRSGRPLPYEGATFHVLLPCASPRPSESLNANTSTHARQSNAGTGTILVVEDEEVLRLAVSNALRNRGYSVFNAGDGTAAIELFLAHKDEINEILLDVTIPGKSSRGSF